MVGYSLEGKRSGVLLSPTDVCLLTTETSEDSNPAFSLQKQDRTRAAYSFSECRVFEYSGNGYGCCCFSRVLHTVTFQGWLCVSLASLKYPQSHVYDFVSGLLKMANPFDGTGGIMITLNVI